MKPWPDVEVLVAALNEARKRDDVFPAARRRQGLADGTLVEVPEQAAAVGFTLPVAITRALFAATAGSPASLREVLVQVLRTGRRLADDYNVPILLGKEHAEFTADLPARGPSVLMFCIGHDSDRSPFVVVGFRDDLHPPRVEAHETRPPSRLHPKLAKAIESAPPVPKRDRLPDGHPFKGGSIVFVRRPSPPATQGSPPAASTPPSPPKATE